MYIILAYSSAFPFRFRLDVYMSLIRMNRRAQFIARIEQEAHDEASIPDEAPAPNAAVGRRDRRRARRARQAAEVEPKVPHADIDVQAFHEMYAR